MQKSMSRILVESVVKRALKDIKDSPERGARNLVDMALQFAEGRFQQNFFKTAQTMLKNENSAYYGLVRDVVTYTDTDRLFTFGMNLGYNGCTFGAKQIRENEKSLGFKIPWTMAFQIDGERLSAHEQQYHTAIREGETLGIYTWMLFASEQPQAALPFVEEHSDSAFFLFCRPEDMTAAFLDSAAELHNLMLVVRYDENATDVCAALREMGLLYSVWYPYGQRDTEAIINGDLFCSARQLSPIFTVLLPEPDCPGTVQRLVHQTVVQARAEQNYPTILWELQGDNSLIDEIISDDVCSVYFDGNGDLCEWNGKVGSEQRNLFESSLPDILKSACPKKAGKAV